MQISIRTWALGSLIGQLADRLLLAAIDRYRLSNGAVIIKRRVFLFSFPTTIVLGPFAGMQKSLDSAIAINRIFGSTAGHALG